MEHGNHRELLASRGLYYELVSQEALKHLEALVPLALGHPELGGIIPEAKRAIQKLQDQQWEGLCQFPWPNLKRQFNRGKHILFRVDHQAKELVEASHTYTDQQGRFEMLTPAGLEVQIFVDPNAKNMPAELKEKIREGDQDKGNIQLTSAFGETNGWLNIYYGECKDKKEGESEELSHLLSK